VNQNKTVRRPNVCGDCIVHHHSAQAAGRGTTDGVNTERLFFFKIIKMNWFAVDKFECLSTESKNVAEALEQKLRRLRLRRHRRPPVTVMVHMTMDMQATCYGTSV
jgi:hypothetical protein